MRCALYIVRNTPPFSPIREIVTATDIDRSRLADSAGRLTFRVSQAEGESFAALIEDVLDGSPLHNDVLREGTAIVDYSTEGIEPTLWFVQTIDDDPGTGYVDVEAVEWRQLLSQRQVPQNVGATSHLPALIAGQILNQANEQNASYIVHDARFAAGSRVLAGGISISNKDVERAFADLAQGSNSEWWVDYGISWQSCQPSVRWAHRRGLDKRGKLDLSEGVHMTAIHYRRDVRDVPRTIRFLQAGQGRSAVVGASRPGLVAAAPLSAVGIVQAASTRVSRRVQRFQSGPATQNDLFDVIVDAEDNYVLLGAGLQRIESPEIAFESVELAVRPDPLTMDVDGDPFMERISLPTWGEIGIGDILTVRLASPRFFAGVDLDVRVRGIQPDEAAGQLNLQVVVN